MSFNGRPFRPKIIQNFNFMFYSTLQGVHFGSSILESKILSKREKRSQKNVAYQMKHQICWS